MPERLGRYELLKKIAQGGMAEIFLARSSSIGGIEKVVVVKRMLPQFAGDDEFIQMFLDEARVAASLNHPNVVQMYDAGDDAGRYYMAMEYLHGEDVRSILRALRGGGRKLPIEHAVNVAIGSAAGLHHAHAAVGMDGKPLQIVHRDVSPHNVFLTFDGAVKVVDFGIAKARNRKSETRAGTLKGKVPYMSPEQLRGDVGIDRRSDVFAVGVMLYEITLGVRPHVTSGQGEFALMMSIARGDIRPPTSVDPDFPKPLEKILLKALAREPAHRYQTARELQEDLEAFARDARLDVSATGLASFMHDTFGERVEAWRNAQAEGRDLAEAAVRLEEARREAHAESDPEIEIPVADVGSTLHLVGATTDYGVDVIRRELNGVDVVTIGGRLTEAFQGSALGSALGRATLLDLALVERVTSFGVREWMALLESSRASVESLYLARCSDAFVNQLSMIRSLAGQAQLVSFFAPYVCEQCGTSFRHQVDVERDAAALTAGRAPEAECPVCGGRGGLDDDPSYLAFALPHVGKRVPDEVRGALAAIEREAHANAEQVEKLVVGATTRITVRRALDRSIRWKRVLDGIEGDAVIDLSDVGKVSEDGGLNFVQALRALDPEVRSLELLGVPSSVVVALAKLPERLSVASVVFDGECASCRNAHSPLVQLRALAEAHAKGGALNVSCRRCNGQLDCVSWPRVAAVLFAGVPAGADAERVDSSKRSLTPPPSTSSPVAGASAPPASAAKQPRAWLVPALLGGALVVATAIGLAKRRGDGPSTSQAAAAAPSAVASGAASTAQRSPASASASSSGSAAARTPPEWLSRGMEELAGETLIVGVGTAPTEERALADARASAIRAFALATLGRMAEGSAKKFVVDRVGGDGARARLEDAGAVAERWLRQVGTIATPVRVGSFVEVVAEGTRVSARYSLGREALDRATKGYEQLAVVGDVTVAPVFPLLESVIHTKGELVVVAVPARRGARPDGVGVGDVLLDVDGVPVPSVLALETARKAAPKGAKLALGFESAGARTTIQVSP
jgi:hypothetical protein